MGVSISGQADLRMAQDVRHDLERYALSEQQRGATVAKVVESEMRQTGSLSDLLFGSLPFGGFSLRLLRTTHQSMKLANDIARFERRPDFGSEDKIGIWP